MPVSKIRGPCPSEINRRLQQSVVNEAIQVDEGATETWCSDIEII